MTVPDTRTEQSRALDEGRAFVVQRGVHLVRVAGTDARSWLQDLLTADIASLEPGAARRSLLLTPTGRIRADLHVYAFDRTSFVLAQAVDQPEAVETVLSPYVLSSDVRLDAPDLLVIAAPGGSVPSDLAGSAWAPSALGDGFDLLTSDEATAVRVLRAAGRIEVGADAVERRRVVSGRPRFPVDLDADSLPAEARLDELIDTTKGCFLGQESVARVRNLGHPTRVVLAVGAEAVLSAGDRVLADGREVGLVTSAVPDGEGSIGLIRVRWDVRTAPLHVAPGTPLRVR